MWKTIKALVYFVLYIAGLEFITIWFWGWQLLEMHLFNERRWVWGYIVGVFLILVCNLLCNWAEKRDEKKFRIFFVGFTGALTGLIGWLNCLYWAVAYLISWLTG